MRRLSACVPCVENMPARVEKVIARKSSVLLQLLVEAAASQLESPSSLAVARASHARVTTHDDTRVTRVSSVSRVSSRSAASQDGARVTVSRVSAGAAGGGGGPGPGCRPTPRRAGGFF